MATETISAALQRTTSETASRRASKRQPVLSQRQESQEEKFKRIFPDEVSLLAYFAPAKWAASLADPANSLSYPDVMLKRLDVMYGTGTAKLLVKNNLRGIFTMAEPREPVNESVIDMTADLFVAKYGGELSVFGALHYYASYLTEFRDSYGRFDLQDVLRQCGRAYLPWWRNKLSRKMDGQREREQGETGKAALWSYLRREYVSQGRSVRESNLYQVGMVPEEDVEAIESGREILF